MYCDVDGTWWRTSEPECGSLPNLNTHFRGWPTISQCDTKLSIVVFLRQYWVVSDIGHRTGLLFD
jgi:hypothetical protein